jgi:Sporulation and spore germination
MIHKNRSLIYWIGLGLIAIALIACDVLAFMTPAPTPTATKTRPPTPTPLPSNSPIPTATVTSAPTEPPTPAPTNPPPPPSGPTATLSKEEAILVYYINKDEKGPFGCGESLWYVKTGFRKTGNIPMDVKAALTTILNYHREKIGVLYNPGYASSISVNSVEFDNGTVTVYLTGEYVRTKDKCDPSRFNDQLRLTIKQFSGVKDIYIKLNGAALADALNRK